MPTATFTITDIAYTHVTDLAAYRGRTQFVNLLAHHTEDNLVALEVADRWELSKIVHRLFSGLPDVQGILDYEGTAAAFTYRDNTFYVTAGLFNHRQLLTVVEREGDGSFERQLHNYNGRLVEQDGLIRMYELSMHGPYQYNFRQAARTLSIRLGSAFYWHLQGEMDGRLRYTLRRNLMATTLVCSLNPQPLEIPNWVLGSKSSEESLRRISRAKSYKQYHYFNFVLTQLRRKGRRVRAWPTPGKVIHLTPKGNAVMYQICGCRTIHNCYSAGDQCTPYVDNYALDVLGNVPLQLGDYII